MGSLLALGFLLRILYLGRQGLFLDEAWSWAVVELPVAKIFQLSRIDPHPQLYYLVLKAGGILLGDSEVGLRTPSLIFSLISISIIFLIAKRYRNFQAGMYAGWFALLSTFDLYYAQEARMYTLFGLFCLLSYALLLEALQNRPRLFIWWGLACVLMLWTQHYGLLFFIAESTFLIGYLFWQHTRNGIESSGPSDQSPRDPVMGVRTATSSSFWPWIGLGLPMAALIWNLYLVWGYQGLSAGGAWIPQAADVVALLGLITTGLSPVRQDFVDSGHLVLPQLVNFPSWGWGFIMAGLGCLFIYGLVKSWKKGVHHRREVIFSLLYFSLPVAGALLAGKLFRLQIWALKPFLGTAYLFYIWMGIGVSYIQNKYVRIGILVAYLMISLASSVPYFSSWQKSDARQAFRAIPMLLPGGGIVLMERAYQSPLAFYYLAPGVDIWGLRSDPEGSLEVIKIDPPGLPTSEREPIPCESGNFPEGDDVWVYGSTERIRIMREAFPDCLAEKKLWIFESGQWMRLPDQ